MSNNEVTAIVIAMLDSDRPFLNDALSSVFRQTVACNVILVVDEKNAWAEELRSAFPALVIHRIPKSYLGKSRNAGSSAATTPYIAHLDADDIWHEQKIEKQLKAIKASSADLVGTDHVLISEEGRKFAYGMCRSIPMPSSWLMKTAVWQSHRFDDEIPRSEDGDWWRRNSRDCAIVRLPEPLLLYRVRATSLSSYAPSKKRKLMLMKLSQSFGRPITLLVTDLLRRMFKSNTYIWRPEWDAALAAAKPANPVQG